MGTKSQCLLSIAGGEYSVAHAQQRLPGHLSDGFVVLGKEDGFRPANFGQRRSRGFFRSFLSRSALHYRQVYAKEAAVPGFAIDVDETAVLFHNAVSGSQAHSGSLAAFLCGEEGLKDALAGFRIHAHARVRNGDYRVPAWTDVGIKSAVGVVQLHHLRLDHQPPALRHRVSRVEAQIHKHLFDLGRIGLDRVKLAVQ